MKTLKELADLSGRAALITGGAGHIALAAAEGLLEQGATVALLDRDGNACRKRASSLSRKSRRAVPIECDLEDEQAAREGVRSALRALKRLDILIHCALYNGPGETGKLREQTTGAMDGLLRLNLTATLVMAQEAEKALRRSGHGSIILYSSIYGLVGPDMSLYAGTGMSNSAAYNAGKGGVIQLARYLATTLAPDVRVNTITPGGVWRGQHPAFHKRYKARTPLRRMAVEEDLKGAVAYLASDLSAYVTGHNLVVDGGWTAW